MRIQIVAPHRMETLPMRPAKPDAAAQSDMFRETLDAILDPRLGPT